MKFPELCCVYILRATTKHQIHTKRSHNEYCATLNRKPYARHTQHTVYFELESIETREKKTLLLCICQCAAAAAADIALLLI